MKKILGNFIAILLPLALFAGNYKIELSKKELFVKEPLLLQLHFDTSDKKEITWIKFEPKPSPAYEIHILQKRSDAQGYHFSYLLFPLKSGKIKIHYLLQLKKAPFAEIQNKILGTGYEQTQPIEGKIYTFEVNATNLTVKPAKADLYGDFTLSLKADSTKANAYEPIYITIILQGIGYPPKIDDPLPDIAGVQKLMDKPKKEVIYKSDGAHIRYIFNYALIADHTFTIPKISFKSFDYHSYKTLSTQPLAITITPPSVKPDQTDKPKPIEPLFAKLMQTLRLIAIFVAGFLSGVLFMILFAQRLRLLFASREELLSYLALRCPKANEELKQKVLHAKWLLPIKLQIITKDRRCKDS